ncbi:MAG: hypothetical protein Q8L48_04500 [Archangium sp.]|nr:hypothetical protein [Archangium sp.]
MRTPLALTCLLSLSALAGNPDVRLPLAEVGTAKYQRAQVVAAFSQVSMRLGRVGQPPDEPARAILLLWEDGRVLWAEDALNGGPPFRSGFVTPARVTAVLKRFEGRLTSHESLGPDSSYGALVLRHGKGEYVSMKSWHPRDPNSKTIATSTGLQARDGRDPAAVLAADTAAYQAFRRLWQELEDELFLVARTAADPKPVSAKLEWNWLSAPARPQLKLSLEPVKSGWQFVIEGRGAFGTVADLRAFLEKQPRGTVLTWDAGCKRSDDQPLLSNEQDLAGFKAFCAAHGLELVMPPGG